MARIWRGGCIIRAAVLETIRAAFKRQPALENLLLDPASEPRSQSAPTICAVVVCRGRRTGDSRARADGVAGLLDSFRSDRLPANLIQAQRDYFGAHTYERIDENGVFHTQWIGQIEEMSMTDQAKLDPSILVIFGAGGDLTWRKLVPALYNLCLDNLLPDKFAIYRRGCEGAIDLDDSGGIYA